MYGGAAQSVMVNVAVEARGVYWARYRRKGCPVAYAVDSRGERVKSVYVLPTSDPSEAIAFLWKCLDACDPLPQIKLVTDEPPSAAPATSRPAVNPFSWFRPMSLRSAPR